MTTPADEPGTRRWRSRAFVQPLLVTIGGALATVAVVGVFGPSDRSGNNIVGALSATLGLIAGLLITGFIVGRSSPDARLALLASLVAVIAWSLLTSIAQLRFAPSFVELLTVFGVFIITPLIPIWLGFGVGRLVRPKHKDRSGITGPE
jgi:hypothetical protein